VSRSRARATRRDWAHRHRGGSTVAAGLAVVAALGVFSWRAPMIAQPRGVERPAGAGGATSGGEPQAPEDRPHRAPFAVGVRMLRLVDHSRTIRLPHGRTLPRTLVTYVRYPATGAPATGDVSDARPALASGPFGLVVFAHGYAVTPAIYARLLDSWARAGYVVAAPVFPLENANAPGGPERSDLGNEPRDVAFVISRIEAESDDPASPLAGLVDPHRVAVTGQSDGGEVALAAAYSERDRDPRIDAAMVLSGAEMTGVGGFVFHRGEPPLLAVQGTADTSNEPRFTYA
jgi:dienelactone hydrolase